MKKLYTWLIVPALILAAAAVYVLTHQLANHYLGTTPTCTGKHSIHTVRIHNDQLHPSAVKALLCDKLTILNLDNQTRAMAFGQHDSHVAYDGISEKILNQGQQLTVTLNQKGDFIFHDHFEDQVQGSFRVN